jgi:hypothetical protein
LFAARLCVTGTAARLIALADVEMLHSSAMKNETKVLPKDTRGRAKLPCLSDFQEVEDQVKREESHATERTK